MVTYTSSTASFVFVLLAAILPLVFAQDSTPGGPVNPGQPADCNGWHTVKSGDTCQTVPQLYGITFARFLELNPAVSNDCLQNFWLGNAYCVRVSAPQTGPPGPVHPGQPANCNKWHTVVSGDTCQNVPAKYGITFAKFLELNPAVSADCQQNFWLEYSYCVGTGALPSVSSTSTRPSSTSSRITSSTRSSTRTSTGASTTSRVSSSVNATYSIREPVMTWNLTTPTTNSAWPPSHTQPGQPANCIQWHLVRPGETCQHIINRYGAEMTIDNLHSWNPELFDDCSGLYADYWVCVGVRSLATPTDLEWSTQPPPFTPPPPGSTHIPTAYPTANSSFSPTPSQGPMPQGCQSYHKVESGETCRQILAIYTYISQAEFFAWNPVLNNNCDGLWEGNWYCVGYYPNAAIPMPPTVTTKPAPIKTGSPANCASWYLTTVDDTCDVLVAMFGTFSLTQFTTWNPSVFSDCSGIEQNIWYCVGIPGTPTTRTGAAPTTSVPATMPTQTGIAQNCNSFWLVSETDTCNAIAIRNGIALNDFFVWNPSIGANCDSLKPNFYVCVGVPGSSTTASNTATSSRGPISSTSRTSAPITSTSARPSTTSSGGNPVSTPTPIREGMTQGCRRFYLVQPGDGCWAIANSAGIDLNDFYAWNPAVKTDCSGLWPDYYACIGIAGPVTTITSGPPQPT